MTGDNHIHPESNPEQQRQEEIRFLFDFGRDLEDGFYLLPVRVEERRLGIESYKTKFDRDTYYGFKITDEEGIATRVIAFPHKTMLEGRRKGDAWQDIEAMPPLHRSALDVARGIMDQVNEQHAKREVTGKSSAKRRGSKLLGLFRKK